MKGYKKALVASLATIGVSSALIGGATFALFSSDSTTNIAVTSGKVNVTASIANVQAYSYEEIGDVSTKTEGFVNGGTAEYKAATNTLDIVGMTPGDWVEFDIVLTNESTVDVKYRTSVNTADVNGKELFEALEFTAGELSFVDGGENVKYTTWTKWEKDATEKTITIHSKVELPLKVEDNNNENGLQEAECSINFKVEAVQGNANVTNPIDTEAVLARLKEKAVFTKSSGSYADYVKTLEIETEEELIVLGTTDHSWLHPNNPRDNITTVTIANDLNFAGYTWVPLNVEDVIFSGGANGVTISNINMGTTSTRQAGFLVRSTNVGFENLTFKNVTVSGGQAGVLVGNWTGSSYTYIKNVKLAGNITVSFVPGTGETHPAIGAFIGTLSSATLEVSGCAIEEDAVVTLNFGDDYAMQPGGVATSGNLFGVNYGGTLDIKDEVVNNGNIVLGVSTESFGSALANAQDGATIKLSKGTYNLTSGTKNKQLTIIGEEGVEIEVISAGNNYPDFGLSGCTVTFEKVTFSSDNQTYTGLQIADAVFNNCTFNGHYSLWGNSNTFNNCTFNISGDNYNIWTWGAANVTFDGCTFNSDGKAVNLYGGGPTTLTIKDCVFNSTDKLKDYVNSTGETEDKRKAAIEIGDDYATAVYTLIIENVTVNGHIETKEGTATGTNLWSNKKSMPTTRLHVEIDGVVQTW